MKPSSRTLHVNTGIREYDNSLSREHGTSILRNTNEETEFESQESLEAFLRGISEVPLTKSWHSPMWWLVIQLKRREDMKTKTAEEAYELLTDTMFIQGIDWQDWKVNPDFVKEDFYACWDKANPKDSGKFLEAYEKALKSPYDGPKGTPKYLALVSMAYHLQNSNTCENILLPIHVVSKILGIHPTNITSLIDKAVRDGYIRIADPTYNRYKRKAKEYQFLGK